jgi:hypothetical protein
MPGVGVRSARRPSTGRVLPLSQVDVTTESAGAAWKENSTHVHLFAGSGSLSAIPVGLLAKNGSVLGVAGMSPICLWERFQFPSPPHPPRVPARQGHRLELDRATVDAGLPLPCHNGRTEGVNTRTKRITRQMHGRAGFPLLRNRILLQ